MNTTIKNIKQWAIERNLHKADPKAQLSKLMEESGELAEAIGYDGRHVTRGYALQELQKELDHE